MHYKLFATHLLLYLSGNSTTQLNRKDAIGGSVRVERNGTMYVVCDYGWDDRDAKVVCKSLKWK